jgi:hypothetical protein
MRDRNGDRNKRPIPRRLLTRPRKLKLRCSERILEFVRHAIEILTECQGLFPPLQHLLGQLTITAATLYGLFYVLGLLIR